MPATATAPLKALYHSDETAWLDAMIELIARNEIADLDYDNLREYLTDMSERDRREVTSRLVVLIAHHLKWQAQPQQRKTGWQLTIAEQQRELEQLFASKVLAKHAEATLAKAYRLAVKEAAIETQLPESTFPAASTLKARDWVQLPIPLSK